MERRFQVRLDELLDDAEVDPRVLRDALPRLEAFLQPFVASLQRSEQRDNAHHYVMGLLSNLKDKNAEAIAYLKSQPEGVLAEPCLFGRKNAEETVDQLAHVAPHRLGIERLPVREGFGHVLNGYMSPTWGPAQWP